MNVSNSVFYRNLCALSAVQIEFLRTTGRDGRMRFPPGESRGPRYGRRAGKKNRLATHQALPESAGVPGIAPHDLRRTCAKLCRAGGAERFQGDGANEYSKRRIP